MMGPGISMPATSMKLSYHTADGSYRAYDLMKVSDAVIIGRDRQLSKLVIPDAQVSRSHCVIARKGDRFYLEDLGSRNGTWLNDSQITKSELRPGDIIRIGGTDLHIGGGVQSGADDPILGRDLGGFELMEILGRGSYGTVYRGLQVALGRPVAIKVLDEKHRKNPEQVKSFLNEARAAGRLNHPNLVQVHDVRQIDEYFLLVMELINGGSMADRLRIEGPQNNEVLCAILEDMGNALSYAASQKLVHRDVKPDNILATAEGVYKLADLGIATPISGDGQAHQVKAFGSAHYVAPEQARGGSIDSRADIYALGASIWHLATGKPMFDGTSRQIIACHLNTEPPDLLQLAPRLSAPLVDLIYHMLAKNPEDRPHSGEAVAEAARLARDGKGAAMSKHPTVTSGRLPARRRVRRVVRRRRR
ncbi:MAG: FHA domain-containing protein [Planctomycetota bacterium]|nr:MAG: FHA domain-containing protein [Planctomycetota bacterium]